MKEGQIGAKIIINKIMLRMILIIIIYKIKNLKKKASKIK